uniref:Large ribosomal subunit protein uL5c n=1 Tax=Monomastix sp. (strain OKE-1) TaxID=141716 RepID=C0JWQ4_MONSK|nr:ribosomal protein L5 [Monomastix sp. OKE-1]ACK36910.1 ribosomal protein L5 [Monomastix sp. OKE-1]
MAQRLKTYYASIVQNPESFGYSKKGTFEVPKIEKIVINSGIGEASSNIELASQEFTLLSGQKTVVTKARKSIASFKIRENMPVGICVTLRGDRMYAFLDRLIQLALPRIRDFQGLSQQSFDGHGNYTLGLKEQLMFPEIDYDKIEKSRGMDISIVTSAKNDQDAFLLLKALGMPFKAA